MRDLSKASMRTRHWKQLVRATGGAVNVSSDGLTKITLGQFLDLGLQNHAEEVRGVIQRSSKDVGIEKTLKTYEEVWLSKNFELIAHTRLISMTAGGAPTVDVSCHSLVIFAFSFMLVLVLFRNLKRRKCQLYDYCYSARKKSLAERRKV